MLVRVAFYRLLQLNRNLLIFVLSKMELDDINLIIIIDFFSSVIRL